MQNHAEFIGAENTQKEIFKIFSILKTTNMTHGHPSNSKCRGEATHLSMVHLENTLSVNSLHHI